ncbi:MULTISPECIES: dioxygenase [Snodgrassella]|uniref:Dioxygenase n=1 Tax=Snodgrassella alvi TaxID=1196083 RepID=A0A2N9WTN3_9NEIS|nr:MULTISPECIES: dioxygenase [Snodgrassella]NUE65802.1 dioxygenase [Snodgrassella sp. ESL0253]PIT14995.1 dioxygenase [Snodgrassella alvi]PIT15749.1 dioxygenase [Snodgrassella alvi]PIT18900.1 dioxygenase [Snodgrassella alvi]
MQATTQLFQTASAGECAEVLDFWLNECSLDQAPDTQTVQQWQQLFQQRGSKFIRLASLCQQWLNETNPQ